MTASLRPPPPTVLFVGTNDIAYIDISGSVEDEENGSRSYVSFTTSPPGKDVWSTILPSFFRAVSSRVVALSSSSLENIVFCCVGDSSRAAQDTIPTWQVSGRSRPCPSFCFFGHHLIALIFCCTIPPKLACLELSQGE